MKKTILLLSFLLVTSFALHAQIDKGRIQIGGGFSVGHDKYKPSDFGPEYKYISVAVAPSAGLFYAKNRMVGVSLSFNYIENPNEPLIGRSYGGGVFLRQYLPVVPKLYVLFDESLDYSYLSKKESQTSVHGSLISLGIGTGLAYDITKRMQLELQINNLGSASYLKTNQEETYLIGSSLEGSSLSNVVFGFRYYLK